MANLKLNNQIDQAKISFSNPITGIKNEVGNVLNGHAPWYVAPAPSPFAAPNRPLPITWPAGSGGDVEGIVHQPTPRPETMYAQPWQGSYQSPAIGLPGNIQAPTTGPLQRSLPIPLPNDGSPQGSSQQLQPHAKVDGSPTAYRFNGGLLRGKSIWDLPINLLRVQPPVYET